MTITSLFTDGWLVDPTTIPVPVIVVQQVFSGTIDDGDVLTGTLTGDDAYSGSLQIADSFTGTITSQSFVGILTQDASLTGVIRCNGEIVMADITMPRGDSRQFQMNILQSDGVTPVDLANSVLRFAVKERYGQSNSLSKVFKTSYDDSEINITDAAAGECVIQLRIDDTLDVEPGRYVWELELTRRSTLATSAGTLAFTAGSSVATASDVDFSQLRIGQYVDPAGGLSGNSTAVLITALDEGESTISFDGYNGFSTESGVTFNAYQGDRKTPDGLSGTFTLNPDVVR